MVVELQKEIDRLRQRIIELDIPEKNKELILKFDDIGEQNKLSLHTRIYRLKNLRTFSEYVKKGLNEVTDNDILKLLKEWRNKIRSITTEEIPSDNSINHMKIHLKIFFTWLSSQMSLEIVEVKGNKVPKCVSWIKVNRRLIELKEEIITPNEIKEMIKVCDNDRDKAIISFLYDSGVRLGELLSMRIKDIT